MAIVGVSVACNIDSYLSKARSRHCSWPDNSLGRGVAKCLPGLGTGRVYRVQAAASASVSQSEHGKPDWRSYQQELLGKMLSFMGPALLIPLGDPLMGLVDSITIGQFAGTRDLAALGPANMVFSFAIYIFQSLQVATLSLVGGHLRDSAHDQAAISLGAGLRLALVSGVLSTAVLAGLHTQIIQATGVKDASLIEPAAAYLRTRALAQPAVLLSMVAQSGMLAQQDSLTPCLSVMLTVAASLAANLIFVAGLGWGLQGAAITTVAAQYMGAAALMWALHRSHSKLQPNWQPPDATDTWLFLRTMLPLTVVSMSKNTCYLIVQTTAATLRTVYLAAHQATFSVWALGTWMMSPIEQACLAFLPKAQQLWQRQAAAQLTLAMGVTASSLVGLVQLGLLCLAPGTLVKDVAVQPVVASIGIQAAIAQLLVGFDCCGNAVNISLRDFPWSARSYVITLASIAAYFTVCRSQGWGLGGVWWGLVLFFAVRASQSLSRAVWLLNAWPGQPPTDPLMHVSLGTGSHGRSKSMSPSNTIPQQDRPAAVSSQGLATNVVLQKQAAARVQEAASLGANGHAMQATHVKAGQEPVQQPTAPAVSQQHPVTVQPSQSPADDTSEFIVSASVDGSVDGHGNGGAAAHDESTDMRRHGSDTAPSTLEAVRNRSF